MKIEYTEDCPIDYEPPHFEPAGDRAVGFFSTQPFSFSLGTLTTPYHNMHLGVRSVLDSVDVVQGKGPTADDASKWETTFVTGNDAAVNQSDNGTEVNMNKRTVLTGTGTF